MGLGRQDPGGDELVTLEPPSASWRVLLGAGRAAGAFPFATGWRPLVPLSSPMLEISGISEIQALRPVVRATRRKIPDAKRRHHGHDSRLA